MPPLRILLDLFSLGFVLRLIDLLCVVFLFDEVLLGVGFWSLIKLLLVIFAFVFGFSVSWLVLFLIWFGLGRVFLLLLGVVGRSWLLLGGLLLNVDSFSVVWDEFEFGFGSELGVGVFLIDDLEDAFFLGFVLFFFLGFEDSLDVLVFPHLDILFPVIALVKFSVPVLIHDKCIKSLTVGIFKYAVPRLVNRHRSNHLLPI
jgi:hypothetical protein